MLANVTGAVRIEPGAVGGSEVKGSLTLTAAPPDDPDVRTGFEGLADVSPAVAAPREITLNPTAVRAFDRPINGEPGRLLKLTIDPRRAVAARAAGGHVRGGVRPPPPDRDGAAAAV